MKQYVFLLFLAVFCFVGCYIWDTIVDRNFRKLPSDWLGYSFLTFIVTVLAYSSKYLDEFRSHPSLAYSVAITAVLVVAALAIILWRKAAKWDEHARRRTHTARR